MNLENVKNLIIKHEGFRAKPYTCPAGKLTIGYGFNIESEGVPRIVADYWLDYLLKVQFIPFLQKIFPEFKYFSENRKAALISMVYNIGETRFLEFRKMIKAINDGNWVTAASEAENSKWARSDVPKRAAEVVKLFLEVQKSRDLVDFLTS